MDAYFWFFFFFFFRFSFRFVGGRGRREATVEVDLDSFDWSSGGTVRDALFGKAREAAGAALGATVAGASSMPG
jgi:hypothetical protein